MQTYIQEYRPNTQNIKTVKPNVAKVFFRNLLSASGLAFGIVALLIYMNIVVGLDVFLIPFEAFGINLDPKGILINLILIFLGGVAVFMMFNFLAVNNTRYEFFNDRFVIYEPQLFIILTHKEVSFKNIARITYSYEGFINKLFNSGTITVELTGLSETSVQMKVVDNTEQVVAQLLTIMKQYSSFQQMQFEENYKLNNIMRKF